MTSLIIAARAYLLRDDYTREQLHADATFDRASKSEWWQYLPPGIQLDWQNLSEDTRVTFAVMGMGLAVGAIQGYKHPKNVPPAMLGYSIPTTSHFGRPIPGDKVRVAMRCAVCYRTTAEMVTVPEGPFPIVQNITCVGCGSTLQRQFESPSAMLL